MGRWRAPGAGETGGNALELGKRGQALTSPGGGRGPAFPISCNRPQGGVLREAAASRLLAEAARRPDEAAAVLERARLLRRAIYRLFSAAARCGAPDPADLEVF